METTDWISVKERLPENGSQVIIIRRHMSRFFQPAMAIFDDDEFKAPASFDHDNFEFDTKSISHWMPSPEPPKL